MKKEDLCIGTRAAMGVHTCQLFLRPSSEIPGGLWSWRVYVDGNVYARGPGSKRKDHVHWYATLLPGLHRVVVRDAGTDSPNRKESNTLYIEVSDQPEIFIDVSFGNGTVYLAISE